MTKPNSIKPTIGRKVWYWSAEPGDGTVKDLVQAFDASVIYAYPDGNVSLLVTDHAGHTFVREDVELHDPNGDSHNSAKEAYATWMPYQVGQAKAAQPNVPA